MNERAAPLPAGPALLPIEVDMRAPPAGGSGGPSVAFVADIDEVAGAIARASETITRPICEYVFPRMAQLVNRLPHRPWPAIRPETALRAAQTSASCGGIGILLAGAWLAEEARQGALTNARRGAAEHAAWAERARASTPLAVAAPAHEPAAAAWSQAAQVAQHQACEARNQSIAAYLSVGGAAAMAATLLVSAAEASAKLLLSEQAFCQFVGPVLGSMAVWLFVGSIVLMGSYALMEVALAVRHHRQLARQVAALAPLQQQLESKAAADGLGVLIDRLNRAKQWERPMVAGGLVLTAGLGMQLPFLWPGVIGIFAGSLSLEFGRQMVASLLPRPGLDADRRGPEARPLPDMLADAAAKQARLERLGGGGLGALVANSSLWLAFERQWWPSRSTRRLSEIAARAAALEGASPAWTEFASRQQADQAQGDIAAASEQQRMQAALACVRELGSEAAFGRRLQAAGVVQAAQPDGPRLRFDVPAQPAGRARFDHALLATLVQEGVAAAERDLRRTLDGLMVHPQLISRATPHAATA